jgi:hypothetical protein
VEGLLLQGEEHRGQAMKIIRHFDILIRRGYFFLKIFSFVINVDIGRKKRQDDRLFGIYYYRLSLVTILLSNRRFIFKIESRITPKETCPICGLFYQTFAELKHGAHPDCELALKLTRGGK